MYNNTTRYRDWIGVEPTPSSSSSSSSSHLQRPLHRILSQSTRIHILKDKLELEQILEYENLAKTLGAQLVSNCLHANIIITVLSAPKRIAKYLETTKATATETEKEEKETGDFEKFIVRPQWLFQVRDRKVLVDPDEFQVLKPLPPIPSSPALVSVSENNSNNDRKNDSNNDNNNDNKKKRENSDFLSSSSSSSSSTSPPPPQWVNSRYACQRASPLICVNQDLVNQLDLIRIQRKLTGDEFSEIAYMRALSAIKSYPYSLSTTTHPLSSSSSSIKGVGEKIISLIKQFHQKGYLVESKIIQKDKAIQTIHSFTQLYRIGPTLARQAYNQGCRSFQDVIQNQKASIGYLTANESLRILPDLQRGIGRSECREICQLIIKILEPILPGCQHTICGGYRRGKPITYDLDIMISHRQVTSTTFDKLLNEMNKQGLISHIVSKTTTSPDQVNNANDIMIASIVLFPPITLTNPTPIHRRVDLVVVSSQIYGAAVLAWTGSITFERDLRLWARSKGFKFSQTGLTHLSNDQLVITETEEQVFRILELEYMPPEYRNCDA